MIHKPASVHDRTALAEEVRVADLEHVIESCRDELLELAGSRILITGGAGFLGYYLVQVPLHWNRSCSDGSASRLRSRTTSSAACRVGSSGSATATAHCASCATTPATRCPTMSPTCDWVIHAAGIASPTFYRQHPIETMDANINGLRNLLDHASNAARTRASAAQASCSTRAARSTATRDPDAIPTPEDYRGNVSCTGPRACYDESKRYGETLCVNFAAAARPARHDGAAVQQLRPGPEDHRRPRDPRLRARHPRRARHRDALRRLADSARSATSPTPSSATTRCWCAGEPGEPYNIGVDEPGDLDARAGRAHAPRSARELFGYQGRVVRRGQSRGRTTSSTTRRAAARSSTKARGELGYDPVDRSRRGPAPLAALVRRQPRRRPRHDVASRSSAPATSAWSPARASPRSATT